MFAYQVHAKSVPGIETRHKNVDIITIRESYEGEYSAIEHEVYPGVIESIKIITREKSLRIAEYAFDFAVNQGRKKITVVHKANIMKLSDGEFLNAAREVAQKYPSIKFEEMIVDATCMYLTLKPQTFDVMLLPNLYGSIMGSVVAGLVGGPGIAPGCNVGENHVMFEQGARHPAKDLVATKNGNPTAFLLASAKMLHHLNLSTFGTAINDAVYQVIKEGKVRTPDIGGSHTMPEFGNEILSKIKLA